MQPVTWVARKYSKNFILVFQVSYVDSAIVSGTAQCLSPQDLGESRSIGGYLKNYYKYTYFCREDEALVADADL